MTQHDASNLRHGVLVGLCLLAMLSLQAIVGCRPGTEAGEVAESEEPSLPCVRVIPIEMAEVREEIALRANLVANRQTLVLPRNGGWLQELFVDQGERVVGGETVMATIGATELDLGVSMARAGVEMAQAGERQAELQLQSAQSELQRVESLHDRGVATDQQLEQVQITVDAAREMLNQARANVRLARNQTRQAEDMVDDTEVIAPFDGVVYQRMVEVGQLIGAFPPTPMFHLIDPSEIRVVASVPEYTAASVQQGMPALVELVDGQRIETTIAYVAPGLDMVSRSQTVWALVDNTDGRLTHGGTATLIIELGQTELPVVPRQALARVEGGRGLVFVLDPDGRAVSEVTVRIGLLQNDAYPVLEGIEPGVEVVEYGWTYLEQGSLVRPTRGLTCDDTQE